MGQLTNLYVSQSYQGLLKMTDSTNGLTNTLQTVQTGDGDNSPLQMSFTEINISGSLSVNGIPVTNVNTGSFVTTSSFNAFTSSIDARVDALEVETGSLQNQINQKLDTGSFNTYTSSVNTKLAGLDIETSSLQNQINGLATTGSVSALTGSINSLNAATSSYATTSSVNALTASINSLNAATSSYVTEAESGSFMITGSVAGSTLTFTKGNGSQFNLTVNTGSIPSGTISGSAQIAALGYATTGSNTFQGDQTITGSVNVTGTISATSASFQYVTTVYETASVIYSSGSNQFGDASNDTQTLYGTVNLPNGPLVVTGSVTATNFTGSLQGTASNAVSSSYANNATSASFAQNAISSSQAQNAVSSSQAQNAVSSSFADNATSASFAQNAISSSWANNFDRTGLITTGSAGTLQSITSSLNINGQANLNSNVIVSGALITNASNNGIIYIQNEANKSGSNQMMSYISASAPVSSSNIVFSSIGPANTNNTGSIVISGSANIIMGGSRPNTISQGTYGYINGNANIMGGQLTLTTSSLVRPTTTNNVLMGTLILGFTTSSLAAPAFSNNFLVGSAQFQHQSGSLSGNANIIAGAINSFQQNIPAVQNTTFAQNFVNGTVTLNHTSSSINLNQNNINGTTTITSLYSGSFSTATNGPVITSNNLVGTIGVFISGSNASAQNRQIGNNILGGLNSAVTSSLVGSNSGHLNANIVYGQNLVVNANQGSGNGGGAFFGRYNDTGSLSQANDIVFGVGTGTGTSNRRTGLWITSGSVVGISGSMAISGAVNIGSAGPVNISGSQFNTNNYMVWNGSPSVAGTLDNFVGAFMTDRNSFVFNNIVQSSLTSGSNFTITTNTGSNYTNQVYSSKWAGTETSLTVGNSNGFRYIETNSDTVSITGSNFIKLNAPIVNITGITQETGSYFVTMDSTGSLHYATPTAALPALFDVGYFYSTTNQSGSANTSGSFTFDNTAAINEITVSGSQINIPKTAWYNFQYSIQVAQGSGAGDVAVWLKKDGVNVANTATYLTVPSNQKAVLALNIWEQVNSGSYVELAYQSDSNNTTYQNIAATGNIPGSPSVIMSVNQIR